MTQEFAGTESTSIPPSRKIFTIRQFCKRNSFIGEGGLRFQIFNRAGTGLKKSGALIRLGRKRLIDEEKYFGWMDSPQG